MECRELLPENGDFLLRDAFETKRHTCDEPLFCILSVATETSNTNGTQNRIKSIGIISKNGFFKISGETEFFPSLKALIESLVSSKTPIINDVILIRSIPRKTWELIQSDVDIPKPEIELGRGSFGTVIKGKLMKLKIDVAIKRIHEKATEANISEAWDEVRKMRTFDHQNVIRIYGVIIDSFPIMMWNMSSLLMKQNLPNGYHANQCLISEAHYEARIMRTFDHPNVIRIFGVVAESLPIILVIEYIDGKSLLSLLQNREISNGYRMSFVAGLLYAMAYFHDRRFIHRDIAARNLLVSKNFSVIKLIDFGLCKRATSYSVNINRPKTFNLAPEVCHGGFFSTKPDIWAFGITCWEIYNNGMEPYPKLSNPEVRAASGDEEKFGTIRLNLKKCNGEEKPPGLADVCRLIFEFDSKKRYDFEKIVPVMEQVSWIGMRNGQESNGRREGSIDGFGHNGNIQKENNTAELERKNTNRILVPILEEKIFRNLIELESELVNVQMSRGQFPPKTAGNTMETAKRKTTRRKK
ncbi:unnamed protein product [Caenorhabditis angaria]|uniref:Protein kinase domain-containing protein n=1 Tax=Caenorhabditis angaria TaxID=860376 RepID=A0A9P1I9M6_9PELO|nr:unnamed protein product [Caenorhabditis angaria]